MQQPVAAKGGIAIGTALLVQPRIAEQDTLQATSWKSKTTSSVDLEFRGDEKKGRMQVMENGTSSSTMGGNGGGAVEDSNSTKARLNDILESFHAFDSDMKTGTRVRRENDEHRIARVTAELTRLEKTLNQEIKRRVEMNKSVQMVRNRTYGEDSSGFCFCVPCDNVY